MAEGDSAKPSSLRELLSRSGHDRAVGSGPIVAIVQDLLSLLIYFASLRVLLS
jgi:Mg/Co/Ni transporter MgtE